MKLEAIAYLIMVAIGGAGWGQFMASGYIGNRPYSIWYSTHCLVEKKGICKWIYFKPKHFGRYTLYEVLSFFTSYLLILILGTLVVLYLVNWIHWNVIYAVSLVIFGLLYLSSFAITMINEIGYRRDKKKKFFLAHGEREVAPPIPQSALPGDNALASKVIQLAFDNRNHTYFTIHNLWDSYHVRLREAGKDRKKRNKVNLDYIAYFKNAKNLKVIKENKSGSLQLKIEK